MTSWIAARVHRPIDQRQVLAACSFLMMMSAFGLLSIIIASVR